MSKKKRKLGQEILRGEMNGESSMSGDSGTNNVEAKRVPLEDVKCLADSIPRQWRLKGMG